MKKFAIYSHDEWKAFHDAISIFPAENRADLLKLAALPLQDPNAQTSVPGPQYSAVDERLNELRDLLREYLARVNLARDPKAFQWVDTVVEKMRPALQKSIGNQPSLQDQLKAVPSLERRPTGDAPLAGHTEGLGTEMQPYDESLMENNLTAPKPPPQKAPVVPKNQKISPTNKSPLLRQKPPLSTERPASTESWGIKKEGSMQKDETFDKIVSAMLEIADMADEAGLYKEADVVAAVLPAIRTVKVAQYEGFQNYWIANGRAFEMAYKEKRKKGKSDVNDYRSPHEVWFEILEEYQKSLLSNQADFISKYAKKTYSHSDRAASQLLMTRISSKVKEGASPGVALYESIEELGEGKHVEIVASATKKALKIIAEAAKDNEVIGKKVSELEPVTAQWFGNLLRRMGLDYKNPTPTLLKTLNDSVKAETIKKLNHLQALMASGGTVTPAAVEDALYPAYDKLAEFLNRAKYAGMPGVPNIPDKDALMKGGIVDPAALQSFTTAMDAAMRYARPDTAKQIDTYLYKRHPEGLQMPAGSYVDYMNQTTKPAPTPTPTPTPTPKPKNSAGAVSTFTSDLSGLSPDQQFDAWANLNKHLQGWLKDPAAVAEMKKRGTYPDGSAYP